MLKIGMLSLADSVKGQGVGSAYEELMRLLKTYGKDDFSLFFNKDAVDCDLYHIHTIDPASYRKVKHSKKPTVISIHMTPDMANNSIRLPRFFMWVYQKYLLRVYKSADYVHIVNPDLREVVRSFGYADEKIHYIPNFVSKRFFYKKNEEERRALRKKYGYSEDDFVCFADGQLRKGKGVLDFVAVAKMLPDVKFVWAGGFSFGPLADGYPETKEMLAHLPDNVRFPGIVERDEINDLLNVSDLFFFPSYQELFPMSILEAASVHLPLLLRDLPEYRNILTDRYMKVNTNEEFVEKIQEIRKDPALRRSLTEKAEDIAMEYSEERIYGIWKQFYEECAGEKNQ